MSIRHDWKQEEVLALLTAPLEQLRTHAHEVHKESADHDIQQCELLSVKTGGCPEDCGYCSQSAHFDTKITVEPLMDPNVVAQRAIAARVRGATRFCLGAAWRQVPSDHRFNSVLKMISAVAETGMEVCCTMGMATQDQLIAMKTAGLHSYNHNLDTSRKYYASIITTRTFDDRLETLKAARKAGIALCCGGILGLGESTADRASLIVELGRMNPHPESVPINLLVPIDNTPKASQVPIPFDDFFRTVATARIVMPKSRVRLSAGRNTLTHDQQRECFYVGANSIFVGEKLLTTDNVDLNSDRSLLSWPEEEEIRATD